MKTELTAKLKKYSKDQLSKRYEKCSNVIERGIIKDILIARGVDVATLKIPGEDYSITDTSTPSTQPPAASTQPPAASPEVPKVIKSKDAPVVTSKDKAIQVKIKSLETLSGKELEDLKNDLIMMGIDVPFISFLQKGDVVEFEAAKNSPLKGQKLSGTVIGVKDTDKAGRKYCKVKVEGHGTFQKAQARIFKVSDGKK